MPSPELAIASVPRGYNIGLLHQRVGQPELVGRVLVREPVARARPAGSARIAALQHSERGVVVSRWHVVPSKKPCWARLAKLLTVQGVLALSNCSPIPPRLVVMLALMNAGSVGTRPVRGGLAGLLAGSVVAGYWQLDPSVAGGLNGGSGRASIGWVGVAVYRSRHPVANSSRLRPSATTNITAHTITRIMKAVNR